MPDTVAAAAGKMAHLADLLDPAGVTAGRAIGAAGVKAFHATAAGSGLLPPSLAATHGRIGGRNRPAGAAARLTQVAGRATVIVTPTGDLWYVRARGREAKGAHAALRFTKTGKSRRTKVRRGTPPLAPSPVLYEAPQAHTDRTAGLEVDRAVVAALTKVYR